MHCEGKLKLRSQNSSYCLLEVVTKTGLTVRGITEQKNIQHFRCWLHFDRLAPLYIGNGMVAPCSFYGFLIRKNINILEIYPFLQSFVPIGLMVSNTMTNANTCT